MRYRCAYIFHKATDKQLIMLRKKNSRRSSVRPKHDESTTFLAVSSCSSIDDEAEDDFKFPTKDELSSLPTKFQEALMSVVLDSMRVALLPRLEFLAAKRRKRQEEAVAQLHTQKPSAAFLLTLPIFHKWSNVEEVHSAITLRVLQPKQALLFEGDLVPEVYFLAAGTLQCRKKVHLEDGVSGQCKGFPDRVTKKVAVIAAEGAVVRCLQDDVFFTDQPSVDTVKAVTQVFLWVLGKSAYFDLLAKQTADKRASVEQNCFLNRKNLITSMVPLTTAELRTTKIFGNVPEPLLTLLLTKLEPRVFVAGEAMCKYGKYCSDAFFIARGQVRVAYGKDSTLLCMATRGSVWGEVASLFVKPSSLFVEATTVCDVLCLSHDTMMSVLSSGGSGGAAQNPVVAQVLRVAHKLESEWETEANTRFLPLIEAIPFVRACCGLAKSVDTDTDVASPTATPRAPVSGGSSLIIALLEQFTSGVYAANDTITSASSACESIIIPVRGRARITALSEDLTMGEAVGFTCLIPHRWKYHICAVEPVQTLELSRQNLRSVLASFGVLAVFESFVKGLMYPLVYPDEFTEALAHLAQSVNPPMFEPSRQTYITSLEPRLTGRFGTGASTAPSGQGVARGSYKKKKIHAIVGSRPPIAAAVIDDIDTWGEDERNGSPTTTTTSPEAIHATCDGAHDDGLKQSASSAIAAAADVKALLASPAFRLLLSSTPSETQITKCGTTRLMIPEKPASTQTSEPRQPIGPAFMTDSSAQTESSFLTDVHKMFARMVL